MKMLFIIMIIFLFIFIIILLKFIILPFNFIQANTFIIMIIFINLNYESLLFILLFIIKDFYFI